MNIKFKAFDLLNEIMCDVEILDFVNNQVWLSAPARGWISLDDVVLLQFNTDMETYEYRHKDGYVEIFRDNIDAIDFAKNNP